MQSEPVTPIGINHLVINVRDMAESHRFWTEMVGLKQVGTFHPRGDHGPRRVMQFYSAEHDGRLTHHDIALMECPDLPAPDADGTLTSAIGHIAIALPNREAWLRQLAYLEARGIKSPGDKVRTTRRARHDPQPLYPGPERLQRRAVVRAAA